MLHMTNEPTDHPSVSDGTCPECGDRRVMPECHACGLTCRECSGMRFLEDPHTGRRFECRCVAREREAHECEELWAARDACAHMADLTDDLDLPF